MPSEVGEEVGISSELIGITLAFSRNQLTRRGPFVRMSLFLQDNFRIDSHRRHQP